MKKLINYLGEENVIISIVENGDSKDNTRQYLKEFKQYLDSKNIPNIPCFVLIMSQVHFNVSDNFFIFVKISEMQSSLFNMLYILNS